MDVAVSSEYNSSGRSVRFAYLNMVCVVEYRVLPRTVIWMRELTIEETEAVTAKLKAVVGGA